jgi:hypothetical protein
VVSGVIGMPFTYVLSGSLLTTFLEFISSVTDSAVVSFGPEEIVCNVYSQSGEVLISTDITPLKTDATSITEMKLPIDEILEQIHAESKPLDENVVWQSSGEIVDIYPDGLSETDSNEEMTISSVRALQNEEPLSPVVKLDYPIKFFIDTDILSAKLSELKPTEYIIISYEEGKLFIANRDWSDRVEIPSDQFFLDKITSGSFSSMFKAEYIKFASDALNIFASVKIGLGEDLPLVILGYSPELKLGFMISQLLENK